MESVSRQKHQANGWLCYDLARCAPTPGRPQVRQEAREGSGFARQDAICRELHIRSAGHVHV